MIIQSVDAKNGNALPVIMIRTLLWLLRIMSFFLIFCRCEFERNNDWLLFIDRGVEYEFRLSARNGVDYGDVTTSTIRTPDGSESQTRDHVTCHQDGRHPGTRTTSARRENTTTIFLSRLLPLSRVLYPSVAPLMSMFSFPNQFRSICYA